MTVSVSYLDSEGYEARHVIGVHGQSGAVFEADVTGLLANAEGAVTRVPVRLRIEGSAQPAPAAPEPPPPAGFHEHVLSWLRDQLGREAVEVLAVSGYGTDWEGSTDPGFYSTFGVDIRWRDEDGREREETMTGDNMDALWRWVVAGWRPPTT